METPEIVRLAMLGSSFVGKTSLISRFINHDFSHIHNQTENITPFRKLIEIKDDKTDKKFIMLEVDDLFPINYPPLLDPRNTSSEICRIFNCVLENKRFYDKKIDEDELHREHPINGIIFVFDLTDNKSIAELEKVINFISIKEAERQRTTPKNPRLLHKILVGNKSDLFNRKVLAGDIEALKRRFQMSFIKTSALCNEKVDDLFMTIIQTILKERKPTNKKIHEISEESSFDSEYGIRVNNNSSILR